MSFATSLWNLVDPNQKGSENTINLRVLGISPSSHVSPQRIDQEHGNVLPQWIAMSQPKNPTPAQAEQLNQETALPAPERLTLHDGKLNHRLTPNALGLLRIENMSK